MCGIAGIIGLDENIRPNRAAAMAAAMVHRGPDGDGSFHQPGLSLVHRRLAIIDPEGGRQPLRNEDGSVILVCNGEIYNYRELRRELESLGHRFATASDCEIPIHAYEAWGDDFALRLRGMFALALLDIPRRRLLLFRDHLGIKPLFWEARGGAFAFASELNALRAAGLSSWQPDPAAIDLYMRLQYIPSPHTAYAGVHRLAPGHRLIIPLGGVVPSPQRYWDCPYSPVDRTDDDLLGGLTAVVDGSIGAHLVSDVPFGALLSGGCDSAGVVTGMTRLLRQRLRTFTIGADGHDGDERATARFLAEHIGSIHTDMATADEPGNLLNTILAGHGQPFGDDSAIPTWQVARLARTQVKMVLSGDGGDELFAGYGSYRGWLAWLAATGASPLRRAARRLASWSDPERFPPRFPTSQAWIGINEVVPIAWRRRLWRHDRRPEGVPLPEGFHLPEDGPDLPALALAQRVDLRTYLPDCVLAKVDAASMAHGLEVRTPLVDREVATFAMGIPAHRQTDDRGRGKRLWRRLVENRVPVGYLERAKRGFAAPLAAWRSQSDARSIGTPAPFGGDSPLLQWFEPGPLLQLMTHGDHRQAWLLRNLECWMRKEMK